MNYSEFIQKKSNHRTFPGISVSLDQLNFRLFDWQKYLEKWMLGKGRCAVFADCGLGKSPLQLVWSDLVVQETKKPVLILAPLAVSRQTKKEGEKFGIEVNIASSKTDIIPGINITNYEKLHKFDPSIFGGIVLDESGILKHFAGKIRNQVIESFQNTPYRLCCTATPSPNDYVELGNHAEFLGVMTFNEMRSMFFVNDTSDTSTWRLKGHVKDNVFWDWLCSWAVMIRSPEDLGFLADGYDLPPLNIHNHIVKTKRKPEPGFLFPGVAKTLNERNLARKDSLQERVSFIAEMVNESDAPWLIWCNLNQESMALKKAIRDAVEVTGADSDDHKASAMLDFAEGKIKCLVTKPKIAGFGMNWQVCHNMGFVGLSDSYEQYYQAVRRCWRFMQEKPVNVHVVLGEAEKLVLQNIQRKEKDMENMFTSMLSNMQDLMRKEVQGTERTFTDYQPVKEMKLPNWI